MKAILSISIDRPDVLTQQVADQLRERIVEGMFATGKRLPTHRKMAEHIGVSPSTINNAILMLTKEGLLVRHHGSGTFVCNRPTALTSVAIYVRAESLAVKESNFLRVVLAELQRQLSKMNIETSVVIDHRATPDCGEPSIPLTRLTQGHKVGAVIALTPTANMLSWLPAVSRAVAIRLDDPDFPGAVATDYKQMADLCLKALAEKGCRSVGLLCAMPLKTRDSRHNLDKHLAIYGHFTDVASDLGLRIADDWIMPASNTAWRGSFQKEGYAAFHKLWQRASRPDGLVVYPDSYMPGIFLAMAELGVRVPGDIQLAYHRNEQTELFSPYPATEAVLSEKEIVAALIAQAQKLWAGAFDEPTLVRFKREDRQATTRR